MAKDWEKYLERWSRAELLDAAAVRRIRDYESSAAQAQGLRWPVLLAVSFGAIMLAAGVLLFVAAHWDELSPSERFSLVLLLVGGFHLAGAFFAEKFRGLATALHGVGTVALGAGIFLAGQIFNLQEHWPGGVLLWALGAWLGWWLLRDWVQAAMAAVLTPAWLTSEWAEATKYYRFIIADIIALEGILLLAITYFAALSTEKKSHVRTALVWIGGLAILPAVPLLLATDEWWAGSHPLPLRLEIVGWGAAMGLPLLLAWMLRKRAVRINVVFAAWVVTLGTTIYGRGSDNLWAYGWHELGRYFLCGIGAAGLIAWGAHEGRKERINLGVAGFALTILVFYFSEVMDKLGRSTSLIGMGVLFLFGGWVLEKSRRRLVAAVDQARLKAQ